MKVQKVIKCGVIHLTKVKTNLLNQEYDNLQHFLKTGEDRGVYSANKQQAKRYYKKIKPNREYPLSIRKDLIRIERRDTKIAKYWTRIPVKGRRGGVWVAIKPHEEIKPEYEICESKLIRKNGRFYLNLTVQKEVDVNLVNLNPRATAVIAVDVGEANPLTSVVLRDRKITSPKFLAKEVRAIRTLYARIRKVIGRKKVKHGARVLDRIDRESRKVTDVLHKATRAIVEQAKELRQQGYDVIIVYGDIKGVRKPRVKGKMRCRKNNRKLHQMPSYKIKHMLTYKALWEGIPCVGINEAYTTQQCHRCGSLNTIVKKRLFKCSECGLEYNRDLNASINIGNRLLDYMFNSRGSSEPPLTSPVNIVPKGNFLVVQCSREEAPSLVAE